MQTLPASTETSWVCVPRVGLSTYQVGHPVCTRAHVEVTDILGGQPSPSGFLHHIIGHAEALPVYLEKEG